MPLKAIDSNAAIIGTFKVVMDPVTLAQGWQNVPYRQITLEWLAQSDNPTRFQTRGFLEWFQVMNQQSFSMMRFCQAELMILIRRSEGGEIRQNSNFVQNLARKRNPIKEPSQRGFGGAYEIMSRCITFEIPVANSYAQSNDITSEQKKSDKDVNSVLTSSSSQ
jgi:hypothetical protein